MHAYIGYFSTSTLAGPIVLCVFWNNGTKHFYQIGVDVIDSSDFNAGLISTIRIIIDRYPPGHTFTTKSVFKIGYNCRCVFNAVKKNHIESIKWAKKYFKEIMRIYDDEYPGWGFSIHYGENNKLHRDIINKKRLILPIHRKSFWPCSKYSNLNQRRSGSSKLKMRRY